MTLYNTEQTAVLLGINPASVRQAVWRGQLQQAYPGLFDPSEIERYAAVRKVGRPLKLIDGAEHDLHAE